MRKGNSIVAFLIFFTLGIAIYFPILNNEFLSDDYDSLYRICVERTILIKEFFRPLIDISFKFNYFLGGLDSRGYYVFNFLVHIFNVYLVYSIGISFHIRFEDQRLFAWFSALLFLFYPFHNEGVVWLTGRLSSIACFFALLAIRIIFTDIPTFLKVVLITSFSLAGLFAYESILFLPFIILIFVWRNEFSVKRISFMLVACLGATVAYLLFRYHVSDAVYGEYGARMTENNISLVIIKATKTLGRAFLPPSENSLLLIVLFIVVLGIIAFLTVKLYRKYSLAQLTLYFKLVLVFSISMSIPMLFGISTRTSESDRLLYFPSTFLCMILSFLLIALIQSKIKRLLFFLTLSTYFLFCLTVNNLNWENASKLVEEINEKIQESENRRLVVINMPDELEGAFVYRNGFYKAMILNKLDTSRIYVNNYLSRLEYMEFKEKIEPEQHSAGVFLPPVSKLFFSSGDTAYIENIVNKSKMIFDKKNVSVIYWNKIEIKRLF